MQSPVFNQKKYCKAHWENIFGISSNTLLTAHYCHPLSVYRPMTGDLAFIILLISDGIDSVGQIKPIFLCLRFQTDCVAQLGYLAGGQKCPKGHFRFNTFTCLPVFSECGDKYFYHYHYHESP